MSYIRYSLAIAAAVLLVAGPAYAGGSTLQTGYGVTAHNVAGSVAGASKPSTIAPVKTSGTLPFTGMDLGFFAGAAIILVGTGIAFRRIGRQNN
jgi:hypothetical protein